MLPDRKPAVRRNFVPHRPWLRRSAAQVCQNAILDPSGLPAASPRPDGLYVPLRIILPRCVPPHSNICGRFNNYLHTHLRTWNKYKKPVRCHPCFQPINNHKEECNANSRTNADV